MNKTGGRDGGGRRWGGGGVSKANEVERQKGKTQHKKRKKEKRICGRKESALGYTVDDGDVELHVLGCRLTYQGQTVTNAYAWFSVALRPQKP